jgi:hypothetical protein
VRCGVWCGAVRSSGFNIQSAVQTEQRNAPSLRLLPSPSTPRPSASSTPATRADACGRMPLQMPSCAPPAHQGLPPAAQSPFSSPARKQSRFAAEAKAASGSIAPHVTVGYPKIDSVDLHAKPGGSRAPYQFSTSQIRPWPTTRKTWGSTSSRSPKAFTSQRRRHPSPRIRSCLGRSLASDWSATTHCG